MGRSGRKDCSLGKKEQREREGQRELGLTFGVVSPKRQI